MNIPNVLVKEIQLYDASDVEIGIRIKTMVDAGKWSSSAAASHFVCTVVMSSNPDLNQDLTNGALPLDKGLITSRYGTSDKIKIFNLPAKSMQKFQDENEVIKYFGQYESIFEKEESNISVFCSVNFLAEQILEKMGLDASGGVSKYGSVASDIILEGGSVPKNTNIFLNVDGGQYFGPVHRHPTKGYMEGARHTSEPHALLKTEQITNLKIKDFRKKNYTPVSTGRNEPVSYFSDLNYSVNRDGRITGTFSINLKELVLKETKYGYFIKTLSDDAILENVNNIKIKNLEVIRRRIDVKETALIIKSYDQTKFGQIDTQDNDIAFMQELPNSVGFLRTITFTDKSLNKDSLGTYKYELKMSFKDPTVDFVSENITNLRNTEKQISDLFSMVNKRKNYDFKSDLMKERFYVGQLYDVDTTGASYPIWVTANQTHVNMTSYLYNLTEQEKADLIHSNITKLDPKNATVMSLYSFIESFTKLTLQFDNAFDLANDNIHTDARRVFVKTSNSRNVVFIDHIFSQNICSKNYKISFDYLNFPDNLGTLVLTPEQFSNRMDQEYEKFFNYSPSSETAGTLPLRYRTLADLTQTYYTYMSPMSISIRDPDILLNHIDKVDIKEINKLFRRFYDASLYNEYQAASPAPPEQSVAEENAQPEIPEQEAEQDSVAQNTQPAILMPEINDVYTISEDFIFSGRYLGDNSLFVRYGNTVTNSTADEEQVYETPSTELSPEMEEVFSNEPELNEPTAIDYNLRHSRNLFDSEYLRESGTRYSDFMSTIPNQIRALVFYNFPFVKRMDVSLLTDIIRNITTQATVNVNYYKLVTVEIFQGYKKTINGSLNLKEPIYAPLKFDDLENITSTTLCRLKRFYSNELKLKRDILSFPIENQYFFITPSSPPPLLDDNSQDAMNKDIFIQHLFPRRYSLEGATTNIISQSAATYMPRTSIQSVSTSPDAPMEPNPPGTASGASGMTSNAGSTTTTTPSPSSGGY